MRLYYSTHKLGQSQSYAHLLTAVLKQLHHSKFNREYDVHGICNPFLQVKVRSLLGSLLLHGTLSKSVAVFQPPLQTPSRMYVCDEESVLARVHILGHQSSIPWFSFPRKRTDCWGELVDCATVVVATTMSSGSSG
jgi:hypothetical protein